MQTIHRAGDQWWLLTQASNPHIHIGESWDIHLDNNHAIIYFMGSDQVVLVARV